MLKEKYTSNKERFIGYADLRINNILKNLHLLEKMTVLERYEYTEEQVDKMFTAIKEKMKATEKRYRDQLQRTKLRQKYDPDFKL
ncbi:MAG: hypothetical protein ABIT08_00960 [Bacteroidia bacterium]